jgi:hypothetical protein
MLFIFPSHFPTIRSLNLYLYTRNDRFPTKSDLEFLNAIQNNTVYR